MYIFPLYLLSLELDRKHWRKLPLAFPCSPRLLAALSPTPCSVWQLLSLLPTYLLFAPRICHCPSTHVSLLAVFSLLSYLSVSPRSPHLSTPPSPCLPLLTAFAPLLPHVFLSFLCLNYRELLIFPLLPTFPSPHPLLSSSSSPSLCLPFSPSSVELPTCKLPISPCSLHLSTPPSPPQLPLLASFAPLPPLLPMSSSPPLPFSLLLPLSNHHELPLLSSSYVRSPHSPNESASSDRIASLLRRTRAPLTQLNT